MGKNGGKHRRGRNAADADLPIDEAGQQEAEGEQKAHRKSKSRNAALYQADELSGPAKYLLTNVEGSSTENKHALYQRAVQVSGLSAWFLHYLNVVTAS